MLPFGNSVPSKTSYWPNRNTYTQTNTHTPHTRLPSLQHQSPIGLNRKTTAVRTKLKKKHIQHFYCILSLFLSLPCLFCEFVTFGQVWEMFSNPGAVQRTDLWTSWNQWSGVRFQQTPVPPALHVEAICVWGCVVCSFNLLPVTKNFFNSRMAPCLQVIVSKEINKKQQTNEVFCAVWNCAINPRVGRNSCAWKQTSHNEHLP